MSAHSHGPHKPDPSQNKILAWLESRTGYTALVKLMLDEPVPGGARWWYVFGSVLTFILTLQLVTGVFLASFYSPSSSSAWASVAYIQDQLTLGWFVRGLHSMGASAMVVLTVIHLFQVLIFGAYKAPREMNWIVGVMMLGLVLAFALTGYLLPWDQKGYWGTQVATSLVGTTPVVGRMLQKLLQGGSLYGNYTLSHFYALHTYVLPGTIVALVGAHIYLFRRHGVTPKWDVPKQDLTKAEQPFWPDQLFRDVIACAIVFLVIVVLVIRSHGAELEAPADPSSTYVARPEWYFLPLFQVLKYFEGPLMLIGTMVLPGLAGALLVGLPFLDRSATRNPMRRIGAVVGCTVGFAGAITLGYLSHHRDQSDQAFLRGRIDAGEKGEMARRLALEGMPPEGGTAVFRNDPFFHARELWGEKCAGCHSLTGMGGDKAPDLKDYNSRAWILEFLKAPDGKLRMGPANIEKGMKPVEGTSEEIQALAEFVYSQTGAHDVDAALAKRGQALLSAKDCDSCHDFDGTSENTGPNLKGRGTLEYVIDVITDASQPRRFGVKNKMPRFAGKLSSEEIAGLAKFVLSQKL
jgi:ubiquinol-cytochrome c reductase cytochrome b subunit